jgi:hypothetical protein
MSKTITCILIGLGALAGLLGQLIAGESYGTRLEFNQGEVYFQEPVTEQQATKLGEFLKEAEFFDGTPKTVQLLKVDGQIQIRFVILPEFINELDIQAAFRSFGAVLRDELFEGQALELHMTNEELESRRVLTIEKAS